MRHQHAHARIERQHGAQLADDLVGLRARRPSPSASYAAVEQVVAAPRRASSARARKGRSSRWTAARASRRAPDRRGCEVDGMRIGIDPGHGRVVHAGDPARGRGCARAGKCACRCGRRAGAPARASSPVSCATRVADALDRCGVALAAHQVLHVFARRVALGLAQAPRGRTARSLRAPSPPSRAAAPPSRAATGGRCRASRNRSPARPSPGR